MKAVILVGGQGTRLRPLTWRTPKCMVPVINKPFIEHVIRRLRACDVTTVVLALGHLADPVRGYFGDGAALGVKLVYSVESMPLGTAGPVKLAAEYLDEAFAVLNGDVFTDLDISAMLAYHRAKGARATIALTPVSDPSAYGLIETDATGRVTSFLEKPKAEQITTNMINAGTYILEPEVLEDIPAETKTMFEDRVFPGLLGRGEPVYGFTSPAYWIDMGTPEKYRQLNIDLLTRQLTQPVIGAGSTVNPAASVTGPVLMGERCAVAGGAFISGPTVVGADSTIGKGSSVERSVIWRNVRIGSGVTVRDSIIADGGVLEDGSSLDGAVLGHSVTVEAGASVAPGTKVEPGAVVTSDGSL